MTQDQIDLLNNLTCPSLTQVQMGTLLNLIDISLISLTQEVDIVENHLHNIERWFGISSNQTGNNWATEGGLNPFIVTSGNADWGTAVKVLGSSDTPNQIGKTLFDGGEILAAQVSDTSAVYHFRLIWIIGSQTTTQAIAAGQYSEGVVLQSDYDSVPIWVRMPRLPSGTQIYAQCKHSTNLATINFYYGIHEYDQ